MKTIKDAVIELGGKWPSKNLTKSTTENGWYITPKGTLTHKSYCIWINKPDFVSLAKKINSMRTPSPLGKYEWGVEYPTNGKRPELADDLMVKVAGKFINGNWYSYWYKVSNVDWKDSVLFKVVDRRLNPADTSYLDGVSEISENKPDAEFVSENSKSNDFEINNNWHERGELPPVGALFDYVNGTHYHRTSVIHENNGLVWLDGIGLVKFEPEKFRPIRTKREKVIEAAVQVCTGVKIAKVSDGLTMNTLNKLYDAGMLKMPE